MRNGILELEMQYVGTAAWHPMSQSARESLAAYIDRYHGAGGTVTGATLCAAIGGREYHVRATIDGLVISTVDS